MKKDSLPKPITILVLTLLTSLVWVSLSIFRAIAVKPDPSIPENITKSLNPKLNTDVINKIESSIFLDDSQIPVVSTGGVTVTPPTGTPLPSIMPSPSASPSTQLQI